MKGMRFGFQNATLVRDGLLIVALPLFFSLVFIGCLSYLLDQSEQETKRQTHYQQVLNDEKDLIKYFVDAAAHISRWSMLHSSGSFGRYQAARAQLVKTIAHCKLLIAQDSEQLATVNRMEAIERRLFGLIDSVSQSSSGSNDFTLLHIASLRTEMESLITAYETEGNALLDRELKKARTTVPSTQWQLWIKQTLGLGIFMNFLLSFAMALFFTLTISQRLLRMRDNMLLLASEKPLNPVLRGSDEIATLDRWFHEMAGALSTAKETEKQILENVPVGLVIINERGIIELANSSSEEMFNTNPGNLIGENLISLFAGKSREEKQRFFAELSQKAPGRSSEVIAVRQGGETFPAEVSLTELNMQEGKRLLTTIVDVTERHEIERLKREFVAMVSHDLRTPLTSVQSTLALVATGTIGALTEKGQALTKKAQAQVLRLINLINDLLMIEKMEAGKFDIHLEEVDLADILLQSVEAVQRDADERKVSIEAPATDVHLSADPARIVQVLVNLLANAVKFSPPQSSVKISVQESPEWVELRVADHGRGIPPEYRELVFERFGQVLPSDSREKGGTGLGLPICKLIVEGHRGRIGVEGTNGQGSTFWFRIPKTANSPACV
jgi:PAS domain S-box-containing protein